VSGAINLAYAAGADQRDDVVRAETGADSKGHGATDEREALIVPAWHGTVTRKCRASPLFRGSDLAQELPTD
jgi:hypothetical protein